MRSAHYFVSGHRFETTDFTLLHVLNGDAQVNGFINQYKLPPGDAECGWNPTNRSGAIDESSTRDPGCPLSQQNRKRVEQCLEMI